MLEFTEASICSYAAGLVGNKLRGEGYSAPLAIERSFDTDEDLEHVMMRMVSKCFADDCCFKFNHATDLGLNPVFKECESLLMHGGNIADSYAIISEQLYKSSFHLSIKNSPFFVIQLRDVIYDGEVCDGLAIIKANFNHYIGFNFIDSDCFGFGVVDSIEAIDPNIVYKGAIVLATSAADGFRVFVKDDGKTDFGYWKSEFLGLARVDDSLLKTSNYLQACKSFVKNVFKDSSEAPGWHTGTILQDVIGYFSNNEVFNKDDFKATCFADNDIAEAFDGHIEKLERLNQTTYANEFEISSSAVKKAAKSFKAVVKLDKNFHVYMHGDKGMVENGYDPQKGMSFYKLYYKTES